MIKIAIAQGSTEWHEFRRNHIGASDAPAIMGTSPWKTPLKLWREKLGLDRETAPNQFMQRGLNLEEPARQAFIRETGIQVAPAVFKIEGSIFACSLDGVCDKWQVGCEIKVPGPKDHALAMQKIVPDKYIPQLQHQMMVMDWDEIYYVSYVNDEDWTYFKVPRNDAYIQKLKQKAKEFWKLVETLEQPEFSDGDYEDKSQDGDWLTYSEELIGVQKLMKQLKEREESLKKNLISLCDGKNCQGNGLKVSQITRKGSVDYAKIPELSNVDIERYRNTPITYWVVR